MDTRRKPDADYQLGFDLSAQQQQCSRKLVQLSAESDVLVYAACGAGKTEIVLDLIAHYLRQGKRVGFAIPRRQVVLELQRRLAKYFFKLKVIAVCGGQTSETDGDLIVCTTHQLYRYLHYFDLLILDEPDAFPYHGNPILQAIARNSCRERMVYLSATPDTTLLELPQVQLFKRPHGYPLNVPEVKTGFVWYLILQLVYFMLSNRRNLIFVPTIALAEKMARIFHSKALHSQTVDKERIIEEFCNNQINSLFCTTVLERGITIENINVVVYQADHDVFSEASLIQMLGRIGRSVDYPKGKGLLLCFQKKTKITNCIRTLKWMNA